MQLGKALLGAIIGAAVGIGLLLVVYLTFGLDKVWLAIPFAIITGLGVRMLVSTTGHPSYARGALTMLIALAAYIGGWFLVAQVATARANAPSKLPTPSVEAPAEPGEDSKDATTTEAPPVQPAAPVKTATPAARPPAPKPMSYSTWDIIFLAAAALIAYEMGRGSGLTPAPAETPPAEPVPAGTHPDA
jgi:hypothetical protein